MQIGFFKSSLFFFLFMGQTETMKKKYLNSKMNRFDFLKQTSKQKALMLETLLAIIWQLCFTLI